MRFIAVSCRTFGCIRDFISTRRNMMSRGLSTHLMVGEIRIYAGNCSGKHKKGDLQTLISEGRC